MRAFTACLAYLYKRADVDLVREQIKAVLPGPIASTKLTHADLLVWPSLDAPPVHYALREPADVHRPVERNGLAGEADRLVFARTPITWERWSAAWGEGHPALPGLGELLVPPGMGDGKGERGDGQSASPLPAGEEGDRRGQETIEPGPAAQGEAGRAGQEAAQAPDGVPGLHGQHLQER
jgi:hypothetical protein